MATPLMRNFGGRGKTMAVACGTAIVAALGAMYIMGRDVKGKEGVSSPYTNQGQGVGGTDKVMNSGDVSAVVSVPKPYKDRLGGAKQNPTKASGKWE